MKIFMLIGDQPRHFHVARALRSMLAGLVVEAREPFLPPPPAGLDPSLSALWVAHFAGREQAEQRFFGQAPLDLDVPTLRVTREQLNSARVREFALAVGAELAIPYGVHVLEPETLATWPTRWNIHGGLSPWYRGVATLFWPSYMLEPQMTGMTVHELTPQIDAGPILHHVAAPLMSGDGIHELSCRAVLALADELEPLVRAFATGRCDVPKFQTATGKLWLVRDFRPEHLRLIYETFGNRIVDAYLDGLISAQQHPLIRQTQL